MWRAPAFLSDWRGFSAELEEAGLEGAISTTAGGSSAASRGPSFTVPGDLSAVSSDYPSLGSIRASSFDISEEEPLALGPAFDAEPSSFVSAEGSWQHQPDSPLPTPWDRQLPFRIPKRAVRDFTPLDPSEREFIRAEEAASPSERRPPTLEEALWLWDVHNPLELAKNFPSSLVWHQYRLAYEARRAEYIREITPMCSTDGAVFVGECQPYIANWSERSLTNRIAGLFDSATPSPSRVASEAITLDGRSVSWAHGDDLVIPVAPRWPNIERPTSTPAQHGAEEEGSVDPEELIEDICAGAGLDEFLEGLVWRTIRLAVDEMAEEEGLLSE